MTEPTLLTSIVLASASPRRLALLRGLGLDVEVLPSAYAEPPLSVPPQRLAVVHAREKLAATTHLLRHRVGDDNVPVVAADTVVDVDGESLGKPADAADAARMLRLLSGREHRVHTAFAFRVPGQAEPIEESSTAGVRFYALDEQEIADYVASGEPYDKAGGYGIQGAAATLVEAITGDFYTVMGFPLARFVRALRRLGFSVPAAKPAVH